MKEIKLTQDKVALVDDDDFEYLNQFKWSAMKISKSGKYYACRKIKGVFTLMHRFIINPHKSILIDHKDRDGLNNQRHNLRTCNRSQNNANRIWRMHNCNKYKGAKFHNNSWVSFIKKDGKTHHIGIFNSKIEAAKAYNDAAIKLHGEFAILNKL